MGGTVASGLSNVDIAESGRTHPEWLEPVRWRHEAIAEAFTVRSGRGQPPRGEVPTVEEDQR